MLWFLLAQNVPQISQYHIAVKVLTSCDVCCTCLSTWSFIPSNSGVVRAVDPQSSWQPNDIQGHLSVREAISNLNDIQGRLSVREAISNLNDIQGRLSVREAISNLNDIQGRLSVREVISNLNDIQGP